MHNIFDQRPETELIEWRKCEFEAMLKITFQGRAIYSIRIKLDKC